MRAVDLFAGCGGMSLGFQNAGFEVVGAFEFWDKAADCYEANFTHPVFRVDLSNVEGAVEKIRELSPDIIIGSPPCQDFSTAGNCVEGERASLTGAYSKIIASLQPRCFVMENVPRTRKSKAYTVARKVFKDAGYGLTEVVLTASFYGVPQRRKRFFCIGSLGASDGFLSDYITQNTGATETTMRDYFGESLGVNHYYAQAPFKAGLRRTIFSIDEPSATIRSVNGNITDKFVAHLGDACALDDTIRKLTCLERAAVQTFPPDFKWTACKTATEEMIGNAVPVKLAEFVAKALAHHISTAEAYSIECEQLNSANTGNTNDGDEEVQFTDEDWLYIKLIANDSLHKPRIAAAQGELIYIRMNYGYIGLTNKNCLVQDFHTAKIVQRIFIEYADGDSARVIANSLNAEGIDSPLAYTSRKASHNALSSSTSSDWKSSDVLYILRNELYIGNLVCNKHELAYLRTTGRKYSTTTRWIIVENTHDPIITRKVWERVQARLNAPKGERRR